MKRKNISWLAITLTMLGLLLAGCRQNPRISGVLVNHDGAPIQAQVALMRVVSQDVNWDVAEVADVTMVGQTPSDSSGAFVFENVQPGRYAIAWLSPLGDTGWVLSEDGTAIRLLEVEEGQGVELGEVLVGWSR